MKAVMLAGGQSFRLKPITETRPKSMVSILNLPVFERIYDNLPPEIEHTYITCYHSSEVLEAYIEKNRKKFHNVTVTKEKKPLGTAGSVKIFENELKEPFLVIQADVISSVDINSLINFHRKKKGAVTISLFRVTDPLGYGIVGLNENNQIMKFLEKPKSEQVFSTLINAGTYVCEPAIFDLMPFSGYCDFATEVFPRLLRKGEKLFGLEFQGYWADIGTFEKYLNTNRQLLQRTMTLSLGSKTEARMIPPVMIGKSCKISPATIGPNVCVGDGTAINAGCKIYDSVIYENVKIGKNSLIKSSVICSGAVIGKNAVIEESIVGDGVIVQDGVKIDRQSRVWPKQKVKKDLVEHSYPGAPEDFKI